MKKPHALLGEMTVNTGLRVLNILFLILYAFSAIYNKSNEAKDFVELLGKITGMVILGAPLCFAILAFGAKSNAKQMRTAKLANIAALLILVLIAGVTAVTSKSYAAGFTMLAVGVPYFLNSLALRKRLPAMSHGSKLEPFENTEAQPMTTGFSTPPSPSSHPPSSRTYIGRHWNGELPLGISYWVNGALLSTGISTALVFGTEQYVKGMGIPLRGAAVAYVVIIVFTILLWMWSVVGIWRSAEFHPSRGGQKGWATAARIAVILGVISFSAKLATNIGPQLKEFSLIALGHDPIGTINVKVSENRRSVVLHGMFGEGSAAKVEKILATAPDVKTMVLNSGGGRLLEAEQVATIIKRRRLNTYVEGGCLSACTYVFLAGEDRAATPNAKIGFHQPNFVGMDPGVQQKMTQEMMATYRHAKLPEAFIQKIGSTAPADMWYPSRDELIEAQVITRVSLGGEMAGLSIFGLGSEAEIKLALRNEEFWRVVETRFPEKVDEVSTLIWTMKNKGANDAEIGNAVRAGMTDVYTTAIKNIDGPMLDKFAQLFIDQMVAAKYVSVEACMKLMASQLDLANTLPKELIQREKDFLKEALAAPPKFMRASVNPVEFEKAIVSIFRTLPAEQVIAIRDFNNVAIPPEAKCDAMIALYRSVLRADTGTRRLVLSRMLQD